MENISSGISVAVAIFQRNKEYLKYALGHCVGNVAAPKTNGISGIYEIVIKLS